MDFTTKIRKEISEILEEIRAGDIMALISTMVAVFVLGVVVYFVVQGQYVLAVLFLVICPISIFILTILGRMLTNRIRKALHISLKETSNPTIILTPITQPKTPTSSNPFQKLQNAVLRVENKGNSPIKKCYARVIESKHEYGSKMWSDNYQDRLKWMETTESNNLCEIEIPINDFKRIDVGYGDTFFRFSFCQEDRHQNLVGSRLYTMKIRIDGEVNEEAIEPIFFDGYVFVYQEFFYYIKTETVSGKETRPETVEEYSPRMIFQVGDWRQDSIVLGYLEKWNQTESDKTSNVVSRNTPAEFYVPDKETIKKKIYLETLNFQKEFRRFSFLYGEDKNKQFKISSKTILNIWENLLNPARVELGDTAIPNLIDELSTLVIKFQGNWELLVYQHEEKNRWLAAVKSSHPDVVAINEKITELETIVDELGNSIEAKTNQLIELAKA